MFTIKKVVQDDDFTVGKNTELWESKEFFVVYHCDPSFNDYIGANASKDIVAFVVTSDRSFPVTNSITVYVMNEMGKTIQTV